MPTAFEVPAKDHEEVKLMLAELERGPAASTGVGPDQPPEPALISSRCERTWCSSSSSRSPGMRR